MSEGASYEVREFRPGDLRNGLIETLENLTQVGTLNASERRRILKSIRSNPLHIVLVAAKRKEIIGTTTLLVEPKIIHAGGLVGHIEDVAVRKGYEGVGIGGALVRAAVERARALGCYKCILDCNERVVGFYKRLGFKEHGVEMRMDMSQP